jgi:hypothetical protein
VLLCGLDALASEWGVAVEGCCGFGVERLIFIKDSECFYQLGDRRILKNNHAA